jgi:hypothetical protein
MFQGRVMGVGDVVLTKELGFDDTISIGKFEMESQKRLKDAEKWRSNTPIVSFTSPNASGADRTFNIYGYTKELGEVWFDEGPNSSAANSQLIPEIFFAAKVPEWVAAKESLYKSSAIRSTAQTYVLWTSIFVLSS